jgi:hypothetical protein
VTIYTAREILTMDPARPKAQAIAVINKRILAVGTKEEVMQVLEQEKLQPAFVNRLIGGIYRNVEDLYGDE